MLDDPGQAGPPEGDFALFFMVENNCTAKSKRAAGVPCFVWRQGTIHGEPP
jgi:hypothetical protein